ncbi:MAG: acyl-CoA dehydrogenase family protein [Dehalococcoidia bacterium]|jgi:alkylation response protein AidB-like acyl-CoA dehydrogenase
MNFEFTEQQEMLRATVREFVQKELPISEVRKWDLEKKFPMKVFEKLKTLGVLGVHIPVEYGGMGGGIIDYAIVNEEISRAGCWGLGSYVNAVLMYGAGMIMDCGSEEQKKQLLPRLAKGELLFAYGMTEPDSGSDAAAAKTSAVDKGDHYVLNGSKMFITLADVADYTITLARTDPKVAKHKGLTLFLVDTKSKGYSTNKLNKAGGFTDSTCEVVYDNVVVPKSMVLGGPETVNHGWDLLLKTLEVEHLLVAVAALGNAQVTFDGALAYAKERKAFGQEIGKFQAIGHMLAEMQVDLHLARLAVYQLAWLKENNKPCYRESCISKLVATECWNSMAHRAMQIFGGYSLMYEYDAQRSLRDSYILLIGGGTRQIQKNMIAKSLGL